MPLWKHQVKMVDFINLRRRGIVYAGMGTGKTLAALSWLDQFAGKCLVLTPKAAMPVWAEDAEHFGINKKVALLDRGNSQAKASTILTQNNIIFVCNYETARLLPLHKAGFVAVVADECQRLGTHNSQQTLALTRMLANVPDKLAMTGTLWHDSPAKLYSIMRWLYPQIPDNKNAHPYIKAWGRYNDYLQKFAYTYEISRGIYGVSGWHDLDTLAGQVAPYILQIKTTDVINLPPAVEQVYRAKLTGQVASAYKQLAKDRIALIDDLTALAPHELTKLTRLSQLSSSGLLVAEDGSEHILTGLEDRLSIFDTLIDSLGGLPVVVFTRYTRDVELLSARLDNVAYLTGSRNTLKEWQAGEKQVLIANIDTGSEGVRLERAAHVIFWSIGYSAGDFDQAKARVRRAGQKASTVHFYYILSGGTIDEAIYGILNRKNKQQEMLDASI